MSIFLDTSALVKYFHTEEGTAAVTELVDKYKKNVYISELSRLEFISIGLRSLDAIHLATFILLNEEDWLFVASDNNLIAAEEKMGAITFNPLII